MNRRNSRSAGAYFHSLSVRRNPKMENVNESRFLVLYHPAVASTAHGCISNLAPSKHVPRVHRRSFSGGFNTIQLSFACRTTSLPPVCFLVERRISQQTRKSALHDFAHFVFVRTSSSPPGVRHAVQEAHSGASAAHGRRLLLPCLDRGE